VVKGIAQEQPTDTGEEKQLEETAAGAMVIQTTTMSMGSLNPEPD
jgi:hypothetical protein